MSLSSPLHLAALATSAVPDLSPKSARIFTRNGESQFIAGVLDTERGELIIRIPRNANAETQQSAEILGQTALTPGIRNTLPFKVPEVLGVTRADDTRAVVSTFLPGFPMPIEQISADSAILPNVAESFRALHGLPAQIVQQAGLPVLTAEAARAEVSRLIERANATRLVPAILHEQWLSVMRDSAVWDFAPTVIHGGIHSGLMLVEDDRISGILGFDKLSVGDPANDLAWLLEAGEDVFDTVLDGYGLTTVSAEKLKKRAYLLHELQVAKWLLHGHDTHNQEIINDAILMMDGLVDTALVHRTSKSNQLDEDEAHDALETMPEISRIRSDTEAFEGLDDERSFIADSDFRDDQPSTTHEQESDS